MSKIPAIPTMYDGVQYRSLLEAKWAAMFNLLKWGFQYEPFELDGWIPDFLIHGHKPVLVEVKPYTTWNQFEDSGTFEKSCEARNGTFAEDYDCLFAGSDLPRTDFSEYGDCLCWADQCCEYSEAGSDVVQNSRCVSEAVLVPVGSIYELVHENMSWHGYITGEHTKPHSKPGETIQMWKHAANTIQWQRK